MDDRTFWNIRLEKIQYALETVRNLKQGADIDKTLELLESKEKEYANNLIEAEQNETTE